MTRYCPNCGKELHYDCSVCPYCHQRIYKKVKLDLSEIITVSGSTYEISSPTDSSPSFYAMADSFQVDEEEKIKERVKREELIKSPYIDYEKLELYVNWGYLTKDPDEESFSLTDFGKMAYDKNRKRKKKLLEDIE